MTNITLPLPHKITKIVYETEYEYTFRVKCDEKVDHGQFFVLSIPKVGEAPISVSAHGNGYVEFTIRKVGRVTEGLFRMKEGDMLFMRGPYGNGFPLEEFKGKHLVVAAGGTGLAPIRSTLHYFYEHPNEITSITLIAGFKDLESVLFREDLEKFNTAFNTVYTLYNEEALGFKKGFLTSYIDGIPFHEFDDYNVVIVGGQSLLKNTVKKCMENGVEESKIWVSFERNMSCSVGKCGHCKINETYVCQEGPVFNYIKARNLLD